MRLILRFGSALALAAALGFTAACSREPDPSDQVSKALKQAKLDDVKVDWDKDAHIAHLKGTVDQSTDRQRAEEVATAAVGTSGRVLNEVTIKNVNDKTAGDMDRDITSHLKEAIDTDPDLRDRDIKFDVNNGVVTVKGEVRTAAEKTKVSELVRSAPGVKDMANALEIKAQK
jgi:hyperosmotically inducible periplasmic protein